VPERHVPLRDGTVALLRPIEPGDRERLRRGLRELSPRSRYLRFHARVRELTEEQLDYLTDVDQRDHVAWVALNPDEPDEPGMGVARYVRLAADPTVAETAVTVADRYQGRGLGTVLVQVIAEQAAANGIRRLRNYVLEENTAMLEVLDAVGAERILVEPGVWQVDVPVPEDPAHMAGSPLQRLLAEISRGQAGSAWATALEWLTGGRSRG
jgi:GNAT superfamily N-acetyltransferase